MQKALKLHKAALRRDYDKRFFLTNRGWLVPGLLLSLLAYGSALFSLAGGERLEIGAFMSVWLSGWTVGVVMLLRRAWAAWKGVRGGLEVFGALCISAFAVPFVAGELVGLFVLATQASPALPLLLLLALGLNFLFYQLLKAPTRAGRFLLDRVEGFRLYLDVAEKDELNLRHPPEKTTELFEPICRLPWRSMSSRIGRSGSPSCLPVWVAKARRVAQAGIMASIGSTVISVVLPEVLPVRSARPFRRAPRHQAQRPVPVAAVPPEAEGAVAAAGK